MSAVFSIPTFQKRSQADSTGDLTWMRHARGMLDSGVTALGMMLAPRALRPPVPLCDRATGLYNQAGLLALGETLIFEARSGGRPLGLVVLDFNDLLEVRAIYGGRVAGMLRQQIVKKLRAIAGLQGHVARTGTTQFAVLLPGQSRQRSLKTVHRVLGHPARVELDSHGEEIVLVPDVIAENIAPGDESIARLHEEMVRELEQQRVEEARRCHYLQRERERHSRPMHLPLLSPQHGMSLARHASTVPMPLGMRH